ncbi:OB-fold protein [Kordia sp.]|uniref:OB-fold protein n=1 Tax=Kordia sp. TaxID=1965332 RepID=UPI003D2CCCA5
MKIKRQHKFIVVCCLLFVFLVIIFKILNSGIDDTSKIETAETFTTSELLFKLQNKQQKLEGFIEKAIEIEGEIKEITFQDGKYSLILKGDSEKTFILCEMQLNQKDAVVQLEAGQNIKLKGILKGFLMDIILLHCVII